MNNAAQIALEDWPFDENNMLECYGDGDKYLFKHMEVIKKLLDDSTKIQADHKE